ncbi:hypothetical protein CHL76_14305 [Marinococcus halophilus]|nr:hypothetical protein CHL76_14305 [Marinococcus halophilus]
MIYFKIKKIMLRRWFRIIFKNIKARLADAPTQKFLRGKPWFFTLYFQGINQVDLDSFILSLSNGQPRGKKVD